MAILYEKYKKEKQEQQEKKNIGSKLGVDEEKVVVKKISTCSKIVEILTEILFKTFKLFLYLIVSFLASVGLTVLINGELRDLFIEMLKNTFM